jgi:hypothetical protein
MWPFKKTKLATPDEFPAVIDALSDKLRSHRFTDEADRLYGMVHQGVWTTSNEFYAELGLALRKIRKGSPNLPVDVVAEVRRLTKSIDRICRWR